MKKLYIPCTKIWFFLTEIPLIFFLVLVCIVNFSSGSFWRFMPLIIVLAAAIAFIAVFFFRYIVISIEEIRQRGRFSSRDKAVINKDKTLIITTLSRRRLQLRLYGNNGEEPILSGLKDRTSIDIDLFRERAIGSRRTVSKILAYFGVSDADIDSVFANDEFSSEYKSIVLSSKKSEDIREISIKFKETL